ncbi:type II toxin-antitoxin system RelE/ParE family toxin [Caulobacter sp. 602-2]|uniref:Type II toxin-antitoxin system RelE/ParE family toxin n=1 Tax=Caulobacter sp. 602-2 TaxID=2710887 RepID=A0A6G4QSN1_9CAUL|nr:type II toxin-antitoxin system RelE/ParE family toxin [Caulobacter sp. 602-2]NGM48551.1 type II toxin-antitoxin system RelE/ParE family toxin [Caulobacter sp. 602-2]
MRLVWTGKAASDLARLHAFLADVNPRAAARTARELVAAPKRLLDAPRLGERLEEFSPREVRRLVIGGYELRYELTTTTIFVLRLWHTLEDR